MNFFSLPFTVASPHFDEESLAYIGDPELYARTLAYEKAASLYPEFPAEIILTADTIVHLGGHVFNKPRDPDEAHRFLRELTGKWHEVYTAIAVRRGEHCNIDTEVTRILFNSLSEEEIKRYVETIHPYDKAGGYAIQGAGSIIIAKIEGCPYNVMGLPINTLRSLLLKVEVDLWDYLKKP